jgi:hypothetical protein
MGGGNNAGDHPYCMKHWRPQATPFPKLQLHAAKAIDDDRSSDPAPSNIGAISLWLAWPTLLFISTIKIVPIQRRDGCATAIRDRHLRPPHPWHSHRSSSKSRSNRLAESISCLVYTLGYIIAARFAPSRLIRYSSGHPSATADPSTREHHEIVLQQPLSVLATRIE